VRHDNAIPKLAWHVLALLGACVGGQTGESTDQWVCDSRDTDVDLDGQPAGFTAHELIATIDGKTIPAFVFPHNIKSMDFSLRPSDALEPTELTFRFKPDGEARLAYFHLCGTKRFAVRGTLTARTSNDAVAVEARGAISGTPEDAYFWHQVDVSYPALSVLPGYDDVTCHARSLPLHVWTSGGVVQGRICADDTLVRFPAACGGFAEAPLDESVKGAEGLVLPSDALERLRGLKLEVVWSESERSPVALEITAGELACYREPGQREGAYDSPGEPPRFGGVRSLTTLDVTVAVEDASLEISDSVEMEASFGYGNDVSESVVRTAVCSRLNAAALEAVDDRLDLPLINVGACFELVVREDGSSEAFLEVTGENPMGEFGDPENPIQVITRFPVLEVEP
jgi:hypothetical protein